MIGNNPALDAITDTLRACLVRAYEHGVADGAARLLHAAGIAKASTQRKRNGGTHTLSHSAVLTALGHDPVEVRILADSIGQNVSRVSAHLCHLMKQGKVVRVSRGVYQRARATEG